MREWKTAAQTVFSLPEMCHPSTTSWHVAEVSVG